MRVAANLEVDPGGVAARHGYGVLLYDARGRGQRDGAPNNYGAHASVERWNLPDADHTRAIRAHPDEYEERAAAFFDDALL
jgi:hypothetical protein